jgi:hypothetical protein
MVQIYFFMAFSGYKYSVPSILILHLCTVRQNSNLGNKFDGIFEIDGVAEVVREEEPFKIVIIASAAPTVRQHL